MVLRFIQNLPLRIETGDADKVASCCRDWFYGHRNPFPGLRPHSCSCRVTILDVVDKEGGRFVLMHRRCDGNCSILEMVLTKIPKCSETIKLRAANY